MEYFYGHVTTQYDGMDWGQKFVVKAENKEKAQKKVEQEEDIVHDEDVEEVIDISLQEIPKSHYDVLAQYIGVLE